MRFTHYMQYFVDLEGGKLIPVLVFFWHPMCNFLRGVLITIYSISWWWWLANRVCPYSIFDLRIWNLGRGFLLRLFCPEPLFDKIWWYFCSQDRRFLSSLRRGKSSPTVRSSPGPGWIGRWDWICLSSASSEIVGLGNKNIIKFCQKVARGRIDEVGSPSLNFKFANQKYYKDRRDWPTTIITKCCK